MVNDYQRYSMLIVLPLRSLSCTFGIQVFLSSENQEGYFNIFFVYLMMTNVMVRACLIFKQEIIEISNLIPGNAHVRDRNLTEGRIFPKAEVDRMPKVPKFRSVDWTHDMIIVKWHLLIWHKRKLCALCPAPLAIHLRSKLQATISFAGSSFLWEPRRIF